MKFTKLELDALREVLNIGSGHASTALSKLTNKKVNVSFPWVKEYKIEYIPGLIGEPETHVATVYLQIDREMKNEKNPVGGLMIILRKEDAIQLVNLLMNKDSKELSNIDIDALKEVGNILTGVSLNVLTKILNFKMVESIPDISVDMLNATMDGVLAHIADKADEAIVFKTEFEVEKHDIKCYLMFLFNPDINDMLHESIREVTNVG